MTFNNAPWAIDGARSTGALARLATYATSGGRTGIVKPHDLKVNALTVPGNGLQIARGGALVLNGYQTTPDEAYAVSNPGIHTVLAADMPSAIGSIGYYLVCAVIGDPEFDQTGHPFMPSSIPPEDAADYEYVRVVIVPCSSTTTSFDQLGYHYPAIALARLAIPASTTTITNGMITDLRQLSRARESRQVFAGTPSTDSRLTSPDGVWEDDWVSYKPFVTIPEWATNATVIVTLSSFLTVDSMISYVRARLGLVGAPPIGIDATGQDGPDRGTYIFTLTTDVTSVAGTSVQLFVEGYRAAGTGYISTWNQTQVIYDVQFTERPS